MNEDFETMQASMFGTQVRPAVASCREVAPDRVMALCRKTTRRPQWI